MGGPNAVSQSPDLQCVRNVGVYGPPTICPMDMEAANKAVVSLVKDVGEATARCAKSVSEVCTSLLKWVSKHVAE